MSTLYGHHVDVVKIHDRVLVVAGRGSGDVENHLHDAEPGDGRRALSFDSRARLAEHRSSSRGSSRTLRCARRCCGGGLAAVVSAIVGTFTVIRGQSFAGHSLADVGSAGGAGAFLVG